MSKVTATLKNWMAMEKGYLFGDVYDDTKDRYVDGATIRTSKVVGGDPILEEGAVVITRNSTYLLGSPLGTDDVIDQR